MNNTFTQENSIETIVLENDDVKVTRVTIPPGVIHTPSTHRNKRVVVWLKSASTMREEVTNKSENQFPEVLMRKPGDVGWRNASSQTIHNISDTEMESLLIELKQ